MNLRSPANATTLALVLSMMAGSMAAAQSVGPGVCVSSPEVCARAYGGGSTGGRTGGGSGGPVPVPAVDPAQAAVDQGDRALDAGNLPAAQAAYARALQINPNHGYAWHGIGVVYTRQNNINGAVDAFRRAAALGVPNARENHDKLAKWQKENEAWHAKNRDTARQQVAIGVSLLRQGKYQEARRHFSTALNFDPNNADARAAAPYIAALERAGTAPRDPRTAAQKEAFARARAGDPAWVREVTEDVARKLNDRSISAGGMAWAEALLGESALKDADRRSSDDLSSELAGAFWSSSRKKAGATIEVSVPGLWGTQVGELPPPAAGDSPTPIGELPAVRKAEKGRPLDGKDLASLEGARAAAVRAAAAPAAPAQKAAAQQQLKTVEIEMVTSSPDAPRRSRFVEPPAPSVPK